MEIQTFDQLIARVKSSRRQFRVAVANAGDAHTLEAVLLACREGVVSPILVGDRAEILRICKEQSADFPAEDIVDAAGAPEAAAKAVELVREGKAVFLLAQLPNYHKLVAVVDGGMVPYPTLEQKKGIIENTVGALRDLGYESPKVGVLACIEKVNPKMPETVEADALKQMNRAGEIQNCIVEGPVSYDCAMSREIAGLKGFDSPCAGDCDALIAPDIHAGDPALGT